jgi:hypothetical protein
MNPGNQYSPQSGHRKGVDSFLSEFPGVMLIIFSLAIACMHDLGMRFSVIPPRGHSIGLRLRTSPARVGAIHRSPEIPGTWWVAPTLRSPLLASALSGRYPQPGVDPTNASRTHGCARACLKAGRARWSWEQTGRVAGAGVVGSWRCEEFDDIVLVAFRPNLTARMLLLQYKKQPFGAPKSRKPVNRSDFQWFSPDSLQNGEREFFPLFRLLSLCVPGFRSFFVGRSRCDSKRFVGVRVFARAG